MAQYFPKSKILAKTTPGGVLALKSNKKEYIGAYLELSNGTYFAGSDVRNLGKELIPITDDNISIGNAPNDQIYNILNESYFEKLKEIKPISPTRPKPTEEDYQNGKYTRYFAMKANNPNGYFEINKKTYDSLKAKKSEFDVNMFSPGQIEWSLMGDNYGINTRALRVYEETYPNISNFFRNPGEFSRKLG